MSHNPALGRGISLFGLCAVGSASWSEEAGVVAQNGRAPWLVVGDPVLAARNGLEACAGVVCEVEREFSAVQEAAVALVNSFRDVPVEERDHWCNTIVKQIINELFVESYAGWVDGIVTSTERDDARPGEREAVALCAGLFQQRDVVSKVVVRVARDIARVTASNLARDLAELVPDRWSSAISFWCAFDLVAGRVGLAIVLPR